MNCSFIKPALFVGLIYVGRGESGYTSAGVLLSRDH